MFPKLRNTDYFCFPQLKYKEDYNKNVKGQWCETPYFDIATARVAMENLSEVTAHSHMTSSADSTVFYLHPHCCSFSLQRKYTQRWEDTKDRIYFMQTDTPVYDTHKKAGTAASEVSTRTPPHKQWHRGIFIGALSCGRHDRELTHVSEQSVTQPTLT